MTNITTNLTVITPDLAKTFLSEKYYYEFNRTLNKMHVDFLADAMKKKRFDPTAQIALGCVPNDQDYLINGQHTLHAIIKSGLPQRLNIVRYNVRDYTDVHSLFSHYDIGKMRTFADSVKAFEVSKNTGLLHTQITLTAGALRYMKSGFPKTSPTVKFSSEDMIKLIYDWKEEALLVFNQFKGGEVKVCIRLRTAASLSVLLVISKYHPIKGSEFIAKVATDDFLKTGDPRKSLNRYMRETGANPRETGHRPVTNGQVSRAVAKAWNKFFSGVTVKNIRVHKSEVDKNIVIKGTPYNGTHKIIG
jgi:hypothetical protein